MDNETLAQAIELLAEIIESEARGGVSDDLAKRIEAFLDPPLAHEAIAALEAG